MGEPDNEVRKTDGPESSAIVEVKSTVQDSILSILSFLTELRQRRRNVSVSLNRLDDIGYGPNPWEFHIRDRFPTRYVVVRTGERSQALIVRKPLLEGDFTSIDELHVHMQRALVYVINEAFTMYSEPARVTLNGGACADPEDLGIPLQEMCAGEMAGEDVCATIQPFCVTERAGNPNYSDGFVAEGLDLSALRAAAFRISREEMRPLRAAIIAHEASFLNGTPDARPYCVLHNNDVLNVIANPFNLNALFDHVPLPVHYSSELVIEAQMPELYVDPLSSTQMMISASQSMAKTTLVNSFGNINERPVMDVAIYRDKLLF